MIDPIARTVATMMARFGGDAKLVVDKGESTYDVETSSTIPAVKQYPVRVIAADYIQKTSGITTQSGTLIQTGDKQFFVKTDKPVPKPRVGVDTLLFQGSKWVVMALKEYNTSGANCYLYEIYARQ